MASPELLTGLGAASAIFFASAGSCFASAHSGVYAMKTHGDLGLKGLCPIIISGVLAIYGLIVAVLLTHRFEDDSGISEVDGYRFLSAGLLVGFACLCSGLGIGLFLKFQHSPHRHCGPPMPPPPLSPPPPPAVDAGIGEPLLPRPPPPTPPTPPPVPSDGKSFVTTILVLIFLEAIGLYGLIVALFAIGKK